MRYIDGNSFPQNYEPSSVIEMLSRGTSRMELPNGNDTYANNRRQYLDLLGDGPSYANR